MLLKIILFIINFIDFVIWIMIKVLPSKFILKLIKLCNLNLINLNYKNKSKYKKTIKKIIYKAIYNNTHSTCLSRAITARIMFNMIGIDNNLKLGFIVKENGEKVPHAWLEDKNTGEELTIKAVSDEICIFKLNL